MSSIWVLVEYHDYEGYGPIEFSFDSEEKAKAGLALMEQWGREYYEVVEVPVVDALQVACRVTTTARIENGKFSFVRDDWSTEAVVAEPMPEPSIIRVRDIIAVTSYATSRELAKESNLAVLAKEQP